MAGDQEGVKVSLEELKKVFHEKFSSKQASVFSEKSIRDFCRGFDILIFGYLSFFKENAFAHKVFSCETTCQQMNNHSIVDRDTFNEFADELLLVTPPVFVDFTFILQNGDISDIVEKVTVYFTNDGYTIEYQEFRKTKKYMEHITPDETLNLRDLIMGSIHAKMTRDIIG